MLGSMSGSAARSGTIAGRGAGLYRRRRHRELRRRQLSPGRRSRAPIARATTFYALKLLGQAGVTDACRSGSSSNRSRLARLAQLGAADPLPAPAFYNSTGSTITPNGHREARGRGQMYGAAPTTDLSMRPRICKPDRER